MARIVAVEILMVNLSPKTERQDAIQAFSCQETPLLRVTDEDGQSGCGYSYTIGTGGASVIALLAKTLAPRLLGREAEEIGGIWRDLLLATHATSVGAVTSLALAAVDTALWDLRCRRAGLPLWRLAGGAGGPVPTYTTEGGWLQLETDALITHALEMKAAGFAGTKVKIGKPRLQEDRERLAAVRAAVGDEFLIMVDANQAFDLAEAKRRSVMLAEQNIHWFEEPMPADDIGAHRELARWSPVPIAVGESLYSLSQFKEYLEQSACAVVQVDAARIGGITPWLKVAHLSEAFHLPVCPHFLMELHVGLACAVANAPLLEYIPQLDDITRSAVTIKDGDAYPSNAPGIGVEWDWDAVEERIVAGSRHQFGQKVQNT